MCSRSLEMLCYIILFTRCIFLIAFYKLNKAKRLITFITEYAIEKDDKNLF